MTEPFTSSRKPYKREETARYAVSVDHQIKSSYDNEVEAQNEAGRIKSAFPKLAVVVADTEADSVRTLGPTQEKADED